MKPWVLICSLALSVAAVAGALAQEPTQPPKRPAIYDTYDFPQYPDPDPYGPPATMAIYFDLVRRTRSCHVEPNTPFQFFVVAHDSQVAVRGWEAKIVIDPRIKIISKKFTGFNVGQGDNWFVGLRPEECLAGQTVVLVEFTAMVVEDSLSDLVLGLGPTDRSSFNPPSPGYLLCRPDDQLLTYAACDTCAVVNPVHIQLHDKSMIQDILEPAKGR